MKPEHRHIPSLTHRIINMHYFQEFGKEMDVHQSNAAYINMLYNWRKYVIFSRHDISLSAFRTSTINDGSYPEIFTFVYLQSSDVSRDHKKAFKKKVISGLSYDFRSFLYRYKGII